MDVIYLCGGIGKRAKLGYPKQFVCLGGKPMFLHGLEKFCLVEKVENIIIPTSDISKTIEYMDSFGNLVVDNEINVFNGKKVILIENGTSRQGSVKKALEYVKSSFVLIGEGVRPFITAQLIQKVINEKGDFITPVSTLKATPVSKVKGNGVVYERYLIGEVQMPQKFNYEELHMTYLSAETLELNLNDFTDDMHLINRVLGAGITTVEGIEENIKITTPLDIELARTIYLHTLGGKDE